MTSKFGGLGEMFHRRLNETADGEVKSAQGVGSVRLVSATRILFGAIFFFDGMLKWYLLQQAQLQGVVEGFGVDVLSNNWLLVGVLVAIGETAAGVALMAGFFQRPAALGAAGIMLAIWVLGGYNGWGQAGYTDPGGDLMLALVFVVLAFAPTAYGLAARWKLRERWSADTARDRALRILVA